MACSLEIVCIGNELLIGKTLNTNATWLAKSATSLGLLVSRITVVRDEVGEIAATVQEALTRKPGFIITTGGLGPTFDDKTLEGIAKGLGLGLEINRKALKMLRTKYKAYFQQRMDEKIELTPSRIKMATLPKGSDALSNSVGTAPGVIVKIRGVSIIALPGVPPEMEAIFNEHVAPIIKNKAGKSRFFDKSIYTEGVMESTLAPLIDRTMRDNSRVYIKSHVYAKFNGQIEGKKSCIELHFSTTTKEPKTAEKRLKMAVAQLSDLVHKNGGRILT